MNKICTSLEQSKKLMELGIDVSTADMMWDDWSFIDDEWHIFVGYNPEIEQDYGRKCYPAWSLSALLDLSPNSEYNNIDLCFGGYKGEEYINEWFCTFEYYKESFDFHTCNNKDKLDAVFEMIVWLKENGEI